MCCETLEKQTNKQTNYGNNPNKKQEKKRLSLYQILSTNWEIIFQYKIYKLFEHIFIWKGFVECLVLSNEKKNKFLRKQELFLFSTKGYYAILKKIYIYPYFVKRAIFNKMAAWVFHSLCTCWKERYWKFIFCFLIISFHHDKFNTCNFVEPNN